MRPSRALSLLSLSLTLTLSLRLPAAAQTLDDYVGAYEAAPGELLGVAALGAGDERLLVLVETRDDALRALFPVAGDTFMTGTAALDPGTPERRVVFTRERGAVAGMRITPFAGGAARTAARVPIALEPITIERPDVRLEGTLYLPARAAGARLPLVALAHGSEENDRHSFGPYTWILAARGYAVLAYDKRGTGESTGSWQDAGIEELAADMGAAIVQATRRADIDAARVAIVGMSEGGWVAPAAARHARVRAIVAVSGGGRTKGDAYVHKNRLLALEEGLSGAALDSAVAEAQRTIDESRDRVLRNANPSGFDRRVTYDPAADWAAFDGPVLYLGGEIDVLESAPEAAAWLRELFGRSGNTGLVARVFPRGHHSLLLGREGTPTEFNRLAGISQFVPGYWDVLLGWLERTL